jgi:cytochrome oxidase Cu insertion factor (SCO1/SenC/PrrC family)
MRYNRLFATPFHVLAAVLLAGMLGLVLAACGDDGSPDEPVPAAPTSEAEQDTPAAGVTVGAAAPDFTLAASDGSDVSLASYTGQQPVLLFFHMAGG